MRWRNEKKMKKKSENRKKEMKKCRHEKGRKISIIKKRKHQYQIYNQ